MFTTDIKIHSQSALHCISIFIVTETYDKIYRSGNVTGYFLRNKDFHFFFLYKWKYLYLLTRGIFEGRRKRIENIDVMG